MMSEGSLENKKILLVEDNPNDVELTKRALKKSNIGNELIVANDGVEALNYFFGEGNGGWASDELPVVVLLDLNLPRVNGIDVLRRMRANEKTKFVPVIILTSCNEEKDIISSYGLGANSFVRKPVKFNDFAEAIRLLGLYWLLINQTAPNGNH
jgi:two-component system, response regulator